HRRLMAGRVVMGGTVGEVALLRFGNIVGRRRFGREFAGVVAWFGGIWRRAGNSPSEWSRLRQVIVNGRRAELHWRRVRGVEYERSDGDTTRTVANDQVFRTAISQAVDANTGRVTETIEREVLLLDFRTSVSRL